MGIKLITGTLFVLVGIFGCNLGMPQVSSETSAKTLSNRQRTPPLARPTLSKARPTSSPMEATKEPIAQKNTTLPIAQLPEALTLNTLRELSMPGDRPLRVAHANAQNSRAIVYLHGMCGNPKSADQWVDLATARGTFIVLRASIPCPDRPGYKWPQEPHLIQQRVDAALTRVQEERGGLLNTDEVLLIGYSQGAHRAEKIAALHPQRYSRLVLGGPPTAPTPEKLHRGQSVAILGGEHEDRSHMESGYRSLQEAGIRSRFFLLPGAYHGGYGRKGRIVMDEVFNWLDAQ